MAGSALSSLLTLAHFEAVVSHVVMIPQSLRPALTTAWLTLCAKIVFASMRWRVDLPFFVILHVSFAVIVLACWFHDALLVLAGSFAPVVPLGIHSAPACLSFRLLSYTMSVLLLVMVICSIVRICILTCLSIDHVVWLSVRLSVSVTFSLATLCLTPPHLVRSSSSTLVCVQ